MEPNAWIFLAIFTTFMRESFAGYCQEEFPCPRYCTSAEKTYKNCGMFSWGRCTIYKTISYQCGGTCSKSVCCEGFGGDDCSRPMCHGSTYCRHGGTCRAPNECSCTVGYSSPMCDDIDECSSNNGGCDHGCENTMGSYKCTCQDGYMLDVDEKSCFDVDECKERNGGCSDICRNTNGSYECDCSNNGKLHDNQFECEGDKTTMIVLLIIGLFIIVIVVVVVMVVLGFRYNIRHRCATCLSNRWKFCKRREGILNDTDDADEKVVYYAEDGNVGERQ